MLLHINGKFTIGNGEIEMISFVVKEQVRDLILIRLRKQNKDEQD